MTMTSATAQTHLDAWLAADLAVSRNQSYSIDNRSLNRANAEEIRGQIAYWQRKVNQLLALETGQGNPSHKIAKLQSPAS